MNAKPDVAVLIDCENAQPAVIDSAMQLASTLGRVALRRGYGNQSSLTSHWQEALVRHGFAPCMQFQYVTKKNTADIALCLDALEMLFDRRAERFVIVTSDSDFVGLCHKLRERGAAVHIFGEAKTPAALRHACDSFHEAAPSLIESPTLAPLTAKTAADGRKFLVRTVREMAKSTDKGMVALTALGVRLMEANFSYTEYGYSKLRKMLDACEQLQVHEGEGGHCRVSVVCAAAGSNAVLRAA